MTGEVTPKRIELAHDLFPQVTTFGLLINPKNPLAETVERDSQAAALKLGLQLNTQHASTDAELAKAFTAFREMQVGAVVIGTDGFFNDHVEHLAALATRRQHHWVHVVRIRHERQMVGAAQGDRAARDTRGGSA